MRQLPTAYDGDAKLTGVDIAVAEIQNAAGIVQKYLREKRVWKVDV